MLVLVVVVAGIPSAEAQESVLSEKQKSQLIKRFPKSDANQDGKLDDADLLKVLVSYMVDFPKAKKLSGKRPYIAPVIMAQNRAGREIPNVVNVHHGKLPVGQDGIHLNAEGQVKLRKMTANAVEKFYKAKKYDFHPSGG